MEKVKEGEIVEAEKTEVVEAGAEKTETKKAEVKETEAEKAEVEKTEAEKAEVEETEAGKAETVKPEDEKGDKAKVEKSDGSKTSGAVKAAVTMSAIALALGAGGLALGWMGFEKSSTPITFLNSGADGNSANFTEGSIADIAEKVSKSVVSIVTSTTTRNYFGQDYSSSAAGTGVIATADGYIITNKHVINGANKVTVILDDGTTYENVEVVAVDPLDDIAYLKIKDVSDLTPAMLGDSKTISVGQQVIAIGNALGEYQNTVTAGIISGTGRSVTASDGSGYNVETLTDMIQTDAAINSGNSGGPLVNAAGEVIGINTATSTSAENMGFAIPISSVKGMLNQLIETGKAERAYVGLYTVQITPEVAKAYNLPVSTGEYVYSSSSYSAVVKDSPAAKAGIKDKDIITAVNGVNIGSAGTLSDLIGEYKPGDTVQLTVIREGNEIAVNVTLGGYKK